MDERGGGWPGGQRRIDRALDPGCIQGMDSLMERNRVLIVSALDAVERLMDG